MKKYVLLVCLTVVTLNGFSQTYHPMLESANVWKYTYNSTFTFVISSHQPTSYNRACTYPDTLMDSKEVYTSSDTVMTGNTWKKLQIQGYSCTYGFIREDTIAQKVYFMDNLFRPQVLLYDFSMQVNDSIFLNFPYADTLSPGSYYQTGYYRLDSISHMTIQAGVERVFHLNKTGNSPSALVWVEGVGNLIDNIYTYVLVHNNGYGNCCFLTCPGTQHAFLQFLSCYDHKNKVYFDSCAWQAASHDPNFFVADECNLISAANSVREISSLSELSLYPNPASDRIALHMQLTQADEFEVIVRDMAGRQVLKSLALGRLQAGEQEKQLDISALVSGVYVIDFRTKNEHAFRKLVRN